MRVGFQQLRRFYNDLNDGLSVSGLSIKEIAGSAEVCDEDVIRTKEKAYHKEGGIAVLYGSLSPNGAVIKQSAVSEKMMQFRGKAKVFDREETAMKAIMNSQIKEGMVVVIRYEGRGGPGMREMLAPTAALVGMGLGESVALVTDGRFLVVPGSLCWTRVSWKRWLVALLRWWRMVTK